ncbi:hypothetical protein JAAARDRAFT_53141 [Jaapia argillacea MUCL 33604]|uniref:Uncharacterized protein n=1 Tax=Jaapia argillacea MUCL 33604 TaxID=933084 RepID=A0A067QK12_9AGAM|nr:hypothetical protein JAAARDRAFT_53141 [Jaapia argillacea MUCL 33604]
MASQTPARPPKAVHTAFNEDVEESDEYDDIEEEGDAEAGGYQDDEEEEGEDDEDDEQRKQSLTALLLAGQNGGEEEYEDDEDADEDDEYTEETKAQYVTATAKDKALPVVAEAGVKRSRGEIDEDEEPGVIGSASSAGEGVEEEGGDDEQGAKRVKV